MTDQRKAPYSLSDEDAQYLQGLIILSMEARRTAIHREILRNGAASAANLVANLIEVAQSVVANNAQAINDFALHECDVHPDTFKGLNLPTLYGALAGLQLARRVNQDKVCATCAYRLGSVANQCSVTVGDAETCLDEGYDFMCHEHVGERGEATHLCRGHGQEKKQARSWIDEALKPGAEAPPMRAEKTGWDG